MNRRQVISLVFAVVLLAGCSGSGGTAELPTVEGPPTTVERRELPDPCPDCLLVMTATVGSDTIEVMAERPEIEEQAVWVIRRDAAQRVVATYEVTQHGRPKDLRCVGEVCAIAMPSGAKGLVRVQTLLAGDQELIPVGSLMEGRVGGEFLAGEQELIVALGQVVAEDPTVPGEGPTFWQTFQLTAAGPVAQGCTGLVQAPPTSAQSGPCPPVAG